MATAEKVKASPLDTRIDSVGREIVYGNLRIGLSGLKTLLAEAQMNEDEEALRRIAVLAARAEGQNPGKTHRALGDELDELRELAKGAPVIAPTARLAPTTAVPYRRRSVAPQDASARKSSGLRFGTASVVLGWLSAIGVALAIPSAAIGFDPLALVFGSLLLLAPLGVLAGLVGVVLDGDRSPAVVGLVISLVMTLLLVAVICLAATFTFSL